MPLQLFNDKFHVKSIPARSKLKFHTCKTVTPEECTSGRPRPIVLKVGDRRLEFVTGVWKPTRSEEAEKDLATVLDQVRSEKIQNAKLKEENNMLKVKQEILMDLLTLETSKVEKLKASVKELEVSYCITR